MPSINPSTSHTEMYGRYSGTHQTFHLFLYVSHPFAGWRAMWLGQQNVGKSSAKVQPVCDPIDCQRNLENQMLHKVLTIMLPWLSWFSEWSSRAESLVSPHSTLPLLCMKYTLVVFSLWHVRTVFLPQHQLTHFD